MAKKSRTAIEYPESRILSDDLDCYILVSQIPVLYYGVYDISGIKILTLGDPRSKMKRGQKQLVQEFMKRNPNAVFAAGYESEVSYLLSREPECVSPDLDDSRTFMYSTPILNVKKKAKLLFVMNH